MFIHGIQPFSDQKYAPLQNYPQKRQTHGTPLTITWIDPTWSNDTSGPRRAGARGGGAVQAACEVLGAG